MGGGEGCRKQVSGEELKDSKLPSTQGGGGDAISCARKTQLTAAAVI